MGGSGKWVKSLIGLKKPEKEDCKVRGMGVLGCSLFFFWMGVAVLLGGGKLRFLSAVFFGGISFSRMIPASENVSSLQRFGLDLTSVDRCHLACRLSLLQVFPPQIKLSVARLACCSCSNGLVPQTFWSRHRTSRLFLFASQNGNGFI